MRDQPILLRKKSGGPLILSLQYLATRILLVSFFVSAASAFGIDVIRRNGL
jgi:hypothetical protein